jgi:hypothetical protein
MGKAILKKYLINGPYLQRFLIQKAFSNDEEWSSPDLVEILKREAIRVGIDIQGVGDWNYEPAFEKKPAWNFGDFNGDDKTIAELQKEIIKKDEDEGRPGGPSLDPDEVGMAFVYFYFDLKNGQLYKIESKAIQ